MRSIACSSNGAGATRVLLAAAFVLQALCSNYLLVFMTYALVVVGRGALARSLTPSARRLGAARDRRRASASSCCRAVPVAVLPGQPRPRPGAPRQRRHAVQRRLARLPRHRRPPALRVVEPRFYEGRTALFPGFTALGLAAVAVRHGRAMRDPRVRMAMAIGVLGVAFSFGTALPGYACSTSTCRS